jgi:lysophospholipase L1-like esterase
MRDVRARGALASMGALVFVACGKGSTTPPKGPPPTEVVAASAAPAGGPEVGTTALQAASPADAGVASVVKEAGAPLPESVGFLDGPARLHHLYEALARLEEEHYGQKQDGTSPARPEPGQNPRVVHILQYGDSHTASDLGVSAFRQALQSRFGDAGRGFVPVGKPYKFFAEDGVRGDMTKDFFPSRVAYHKGGKFTGVDGDYGLLGIGIASSIPGAQAWTDVASPTTHLEFAYLEHPNGGAFEVSVDGVTAGKVDTAGAQVSSGFASFDTTDGPHKIGIKTTSEGEVRIFGVALSRTQPGVVVDALGINGAQILTPLRWNEEHFAEQLRHRAPDLVILAYGTNESLEPKLTDADYEARLVAMLGRVSRAVPSASCLLLGPPDLARRADPKSDKSDWKPWRRVAELAAIQRRVAQAAGCAFYDQLAAMGGPGSMIQWTFGLEPRAKPDHVHFTKNGYTQLGTAFATDLLHAYSTWRASPR